jgi:hypothetical protein
MIETDNKGSVRQLSFLQEAQLKQDAFILLLCAVSLLAATALLEFCRRRFVKKRLPIDNEDEAAAV